MVWLPLLMMIYTRHHLSPGANCAPGTTGILAMALTLARIPSMFSNHSLTCSCRRRRKYNANLAA